MPYLLQLLLHKVILADDVAPELKLAVISVGNKSTLVVELTETVERIDASEDLILIEGGSTITVSVSPVISEIDKGKFYVTRSGITDFTTVSTITLELNAVALDADKIKSEAGNLALFNKTIFGRALATIRR